MRRAFDSFAHQLGTVRPASDGLSAPVPLLQDFYRALAQRDYTALGSYLTDDVIFEMHGLPTAPPQPVKGKASVLPLFQASFEAIEPAQSIVETLLAEGNQLVLVATDHGHFAATKEPYSVRFILELTLRAQQLSHIREWIIPLSASKESGESLP